jgi:hypothetical protein
MALQASMAIRRFSMQLLPSISDAGFASTGSFRYPEFLRAKYCLPRISIGASQAHPVVQRREFRRRSEPQADAINRSFGSDLVRKARKSAPDTLVTRRRRNGGLFRRIHPLLRLRKIIALFVILVNNYCYIS